MSNNSEQEIQKYTIDVSKLDQKIKQLKQDNDRLRQNQEQLNKAYNQGRINADQFASATKKNNAALSGTRASATALADAISKVGGSVGTLGTTIKSVLSAGPLAIITLIATAISALVDHIRSAQQEAAELAQQTAEIHWGNVLDEQMDAFDKKMEQEKEFAKIQHGEFKTESERAEFEIEWNNKLIKEQDTLIEGLQLESGLRADQVSDLETTEKTIAELHKKLEEEKNSWIVNKSLVEQFTKQIQYATKMAELQRRKSKEAMAEDEKERARRNAAEKDRQKAAKEAAARAKEQAQAQAKYANDQYNLSVDLNKRKRQLEIEAIKDDKKRKLAQIDFERDEQLKAYNEQYKTANKANRKLLDDMKKAAIENAKTQKQAVIDASKVTEVRIDKLTDKIKGLVKEISSGLNEVDRQLGTDIEYLQGSLSEAEYSYKTLENANLEVAKAEQKEIAAEKERYDTTIKGINEQREEEEAAYKKDLENFKDDEVKKAEIEQTHRDSQEQFRQAELEAEKVKANNINAIQTDAQNKREKNQIDYYKREKERMKDEWESKLNYATTAISGIGELENSLAELQTEDSRKQFKLQEAAMYMNFATALATGIANAAEAGWPAMLATIPSTIAMLIADFASAKKLHAKAKEAKFATGGLVAGPGTETSDSINAKLSNGEYVVNAASTSQFLPLLQALNNSGVAQVQGNLLASQNSNLMLAEAMGNVRPVVSVESINRATNTYNQVLTLSKL